MDPAYGARYRELHARHWWWRARERVVVHELERLRPPGGWSRILDVGCGDGLFFGVLRRYGKRVEGVEPDAALVSAGGGREEVIHIQPFDTDFAPDRRYGLILFLDVLEHMPDPAAAVSHAASLLESGGVVLVTVPAFRHLWTTHDDLNHHLTRYTRRQLETILSGPLTVEKIRYFFRWVYPAKLLVRASEAVRRPRPAPPTLPRAPLNRALYGLSRLDEALLGRIPLPIGSSLLAVARRV